MRLAGYLLLTAATYYMAGMYRSLPLMLLFVMELVLLAVMRILPFYLRRAFSLKFSEEAVMAERTEEMLCHIHVCNRAWLPVSRFRIRLALRYQQGGRRIKRKLYGGVRERGEADMEFRLTLPYCGLVLLELDKVLLYDYLSFFSSGKRLEGELEAAVFPRERALQIELPASVYQEYRQEGELAVPARGMEQQEIRQLREYLPGDSIRLIHWNQSVRTGRLWVKEFEAERECRVELFLDLRIFGKARPGQMHAFYELLSALVMGLLKTAVSVRVSWQEGQAFLTEEIRGTEELRRLLLRLYHMDFPKKKKREEAAVLPAGADLLRLDMELGLYCRGRLLYRFSRKELDREIESRVYMMGNMDM